MYVHNHVRVYETYKLQKRKMRDLSSECRLVELLLFRATFACDR